MSEAASGTIRRRASTTGGGDPHDALKPLIQAADRSFNGADFALDSLEIRPHRPACRGGQHAIAGALQQAHLQRPFKGFQPAADRGLIDAQMPGRIRQTPAAKDFKKIAEVVPVEFVHLSKTSNTRRLHGGGFSRIADLILPKENDAVVPAYILLRTLFARQDCLANASMSPRLHVAQQRHIGGCHVDAPAVRSDGRFVF